VTALTPMQLRVASPQEFDQLSDLRPFARAMLQTLAAQQRLAYDHSAARATAQPLVSH